MIRTALKAIGSDRQLRVDDVQADLSRTLMVDAWQLYRLHFGGFTASRVDPQFARLDHPAQYVAQPMVSPGTTIVVAGAGPSLAVCAPELLRLRKRLSIWTSIRGAEALATHGLTPDLIAVQHSSDLDAYLTVRHLRDRNGANPILTAPAVLAEPKTPASLLAGLDGERLATFDPACGWGHWPASLAWLACSAGARAIALAGIDLGASDAADPSQEPLRGLLGEIAGGASVPTIDAGHGAIKAGWARQSLDITVGASGKPDVVFDNHPWTSPDQRRAELEATLIALRDYIDAAATFRARAMEQRVTRDTTREGPLAEAWQILRRWRDSESIRVAFQEGLGVTFLPRFWRMEDRDVVGPMWRPIVLATDEIVRQATAAHTRLLSPVPA